MLEVITDMTMLWFSVVITVLLIAAFARSSLSGFEWKIRTIRKNHFNQFDVQKCLETTHTRPSSVVYRPKIPAISDKVNPDDEEEQPLVV
ncbi:hypothetical protein [Bacillus solitudinis]|uniref:hypothetical protein n=1 Tax=Bacillus solitudinis TaxID=2014074 RepID=UPI000C23382C|nr:hypothetical protein [Bacillus solitudinis]